MEITDARPVVLCSIPGEPRQFIADEKLALDPKYTNIHCIITFKISPNSIDRHLLIGFPRIWHIRVVFTHDDWQIFRLKCNHKKFPTTAQISEAIRGISE